MRHTNTLFVDIETFSSIDLTKYGVYAYSESEDFEVMMCAWSLDDGPVNLAVGAGEIMQIPGLWSDEVLKVAHNAQFERVCFSAFLGYPPGTYLDPAHWEDTAALAAENGLPRSLRLLAKALGAEEKDEAGTRLINLFCKPRRPTKNDPRTRNTEESHPTEWEAFCAYCIQDVATLKDIYARVPGWPTSFERTLWETDQRIADRGIMTDQQLARAAVAADAANQDLFATELRELLGIENAGSVVQIKSALASRGLKVGSLDKETIDGLLAKPVLKAEVRRALELRQELALVASKKYETSIYSASPDGRLRGALRFFGAHTGRWSSGGVQIQNLAREQFAKKDSTGKKVWDGAAELDALLRLCLDGQAEPVTLKRLVRSLFLGDFAVADYSAIEARVLAWVSGESWVLEAFRNKRDIYVETAERMSTKDRPLTRAQGKVAVLALGYNGGINSLRNMGAEGTDEELQSLVYQWRRANPRTCRLWGTMEEAFWSGGTAGRIRVEASGRDRRVVLPSGRWLSYYGIGRNSDGGLEFKDYTGGGRGVTGKGTTHTYGGRLVENVVQAISRDLLAEALVSLERAGLRTVAHIHDEVLVEVDDRSQLAEVERHMTTLPSWAKGFPLDAEGYYCERYHKA